MSAFDPTGLATLEDVEALYRLTHAREPSSTERDAALATPMGAWVPALFRSEAFQRMRAGVARRQPMSPDYALPVGARFADWAANFFPLLGVSREAVRSADEWPLLLELLFSDRRFRKGVAREWRGISVRAFLSGLRAARHRPLQISGAVESWSTGSVTGWAVDRRVPDRHLVLELFFEGQFVAAATTGRVQHDIGGRWGKHLRLGFEIALPLAAFGGKQGIAEVREAISGVVIGRFETSGIERPSLDAVAQLQEELARLRRMLDGIESKLPAYNRALGYPLSAYDAYYRAYYEPVQRSICAGSETISAYVVVDAFDASSAALLATIDGIAAQGCRPNEVIVLADAGDHRLEMEDVVRKAAYRPNGIAADLHIMARTERAGALHRCAHETDAAVIILCPAGCRFSPDAVAAFAAAVPTRGAVAYSDSDEVCDDGGGRMRHGAPQLRSGFDHSLVLQQDLCGPVLALSTAHLRQTLPLAGSDAALAFGLTLQAAARGIEILHLPRILYHLERPAVSHAGARLPLVRDHLVQQHPGADAELWQGEAAGAADKIRVRWPVPEGLRASIIIPTRDRLDLLLPCLGSIEASIASNRVALDVLIVNNRSEDATTRSFLARAERYPGVRVLDYDGVFNWAAMNNLAAEQVDSDVLIFLNNDTIALAPDCWDDLCGQAMRRDVGAVGARLLYEDGTIQHAGVVMDEWHSFASHEGVGDPASDPGYLDRHILVREVAMVTGACLATRTSVFRDSGGFDAANFPVEGNDTDYCLRLRSMDYKIIYDGQASLYHFESKSRGYNDDTVKRRRADEATRLLKARWGDRFAEDPYYNAHFDRLALPFTRLQAPRPGTLAIALP